MSQFGAQHLAGQQLTISWTGLAVGITLQAIGDVNYARETDEENVSAGGAIIAKNTFNPRETLSGQFLVKGSAPEGITMPARGTVVTLSGSPVDAIDGTWNAGNMSIAMSDGAGRMSIELDRPAAGSLAAV